MIGLVLGAALGAESVAAPPDSADMPAIIEVSEVTPGMRGFGRTVFRGAKLEEFDVEVLGRTRSMTAGSPIILVRLKSTMLEKTGVIAGMSGSPVFVRSEPDGQPRLLGAVAYGFPFSKTPLVGVTPAEEMVKVRDMDVEEADADEMQEARAGAWRRLVEAGRRSGRALRSGESSPREIRRRMLRVLLSGPGREGTGRGLEVDNLPRGARELLLPGAGDRMQVLPLPVAVGGKAGRAYDSVAPLLRLGGHVAVQALDSGSKDAEAPAELRPGMPVGAVWLTGDLELAGMGTVTMVEGDRLVAFGHPMAGTGRTNLPLAAGRVEAVVPSYQRSFRLASIGRIIGRMTQDRRSGIVGRLGESAPMFPCVVHVSGDRPTTFRYRAAGYWQVAPIAGFYSVAASTLQWDGQGSPETVLGIARISLKGREEPIVLKNLYAGFNPLQPAQELVLGPLSRLTVNPFREVEVTGLDVDLQISRGIRAARIESVRLERDSVRPGEEVSLWVRLREFQGGEHTRKINLTVPADARPGTGAEVIIGGWQTYRMLQMSLDPGFYQPDDLDALIEVIRDIPSSTKIYVRAGFVRRGVRYNGEAMPGLPGSMNTMLTEGTDSGRSTRLMEDVGTSLDTHWVIEGAQRVSVNVREKGGSAGLSY